MGYFSPPQILTQLLSMSLTVGISWPLFSIGLCKNRCMMSTGRHRHSLTPQHSHASWNGLTVTKFPCRSTTYWLIQRAARSTIEREPWVMAWVLKCLLKNSFTMGNRECQATGLKHTHTRPKYINKHTKPQGICAYWKHIVEDSSPKEAIKVLLDRQIDR